MDLIYHPIGDAVSLVEPLSSRCCTSDETALQYIDDIYLRVPYDSKLDSQEGQQHPVVCIPSRRLAQRRHSCHRQAAVFAPRDDGDWPVALRTSQTPTGRTAYVSTR